MCIHTTYSALLINHGGPLSQTEGIPLVQQRQNTMFRLIKKKLETLLKHALQKNILGYI